MSFEQLEPQDAHARLNASEGALYVDVRSEQEFEQGHPAAALNLPIMHFGQMGMQPNPDFLAVAEAVLPKESLLVVGCKSGGRSARACGLLAQAGFHRLVNVAGGYHGEHDRMTGELLVAGWEACGLPTTTVAEPGTTWKELQARLG